MIDFMLVIFQKKHTMLVAALCFAHRVGCVFSKVLRLFLSSACGKLSFNRRQVIHANQRNEGFTLLELLVVVALMSVVAVAAVMSLDNVDDTAAVQVARSEMVEISKALKLFKRDVGHFPDAADEIKYVGAPDPIEEMKFEAAKLNLLRTCQATDIGKVTLAEPTYDVHCKDWNIDTARGWHGPYLSRDGNTMFVNDPWGNPYVLRGSSSDIRIISFGADGAYGGDHAVVDPEDICKANDASASGKDDLVLCLLM
jgi:general secretion pathway protein G